MAALTKAQIIAQSIFPRLAADRFREDAEYRQAIEQLVQMGVGGFCVMSGTPAQVAGVTATLQQQAPVPLLFAADFEWGLPMRLEGGTPFPNAYALGVVDDQPLTFRVAECIAREARAIGVHWIFAPVADALLNPQNVVIGVRAFGQEAQRVTRHVVPFLQGIEHHHLLACAKHFPGHGASAGDSHQELPIIEHSLETLMQRSLPPFVAALAVAVRAVMVAHVAYPQVEPDGKVLPASLSETFVQKLLRQQLQYRGIIVTDALDMAAIAQWGEETAAVVRAKAVGNDVLLMPSDPLRAIKACRKAVDTGQIPFALFEQSFERLTAAREYVGLVGETVVEPEIRVEEHRRVALLAAHRALRWAKGQVPACFPLHQWEELAVLAFVDNDADMGYATYAFQYVSTFWERECHVGYIDHTITAKEIEQLREHLLTAEILIFLIFATHRSHGLMQHPAKIREIIAAFREERPAIAVIFGHPMVGEELPVDGVLHAYSFTEPSIVTALSQLFHKEQVE